MLYYIGPYIRFFYSFVLTNLDFILFVMGNAHFLPEHFCLWNWSKNTNGKVSSALHDTTMYVCNGTQCNRLQVRENELKSDPVMGLTSHAEEADSRIQYSCMQNILQTIAITLTLF